MKKGISILLIGLLFVSACSFVSEPAETPEVPAPAVQEEMVQEYINVSLSPEFKIVARQATRVPPVVWGTVENTGLGAGDVKVRVQAHYAGVVSQEKTQMLTIKSKEQANFSVEFDKTTQWTAYLVILEPMTPNAVPVYS